MSERFFRKWFIWLLNCPGSVSSQNRCAANAAMATNSTSSHAAQRARQPTMSRIEPPISMMIAITIEIGGSILLIVGWRARWAAWLLVLFVAIAAFAAHRFWELTDPGQFNNQMNHFLKNLSLIGGLLYVATFGPGSASVDKS